MDWIVWQAIIDYVSEFWDRRLYPGKMWPNVNVWTDGDQLLVDNEAQADAIAFVLRAMGMDPHTGYYDPKEDARSGETDGHTGWWYIDID